VLSWFLFSFVILGNGTFVCTYDDAMELYSSSFPEIQQLVDKVREKQGIVEAQKFYIDYLKSDEQGKAFANSLICLNSIGMTLPEIQIEEKQKGEPIIGWLITAVVTGGAVVGGIILTRHFEHKGIISKNEEAILTEVDTIFNILITRDPISYTTFNGWEISYTDAFLKTSAFQSVISSGQFTYFSGDKQDVISDFYNLIDTHNELVKEIDELSHISDLQEIRNWKEFRENIESKQLMMTKIEDDIQNQLLPLLYFLLGRTTSYLLE